MLVFHFSMTLGVAVLFTSSTLIKEGLAQEAPLAAFGAEQKILGNVNRPDLMASG
jgi:hypothetical protein